MRAGADGDAEQLQALVAAVLASAHYRQVSPELVRRIGGRELARRRSFKEAVKATKNTLHQVGGVYQSGKEDYDAWLSMLERGYSSGDRDEVRVACARVMEHHTSTRERLPILHEFYQRIFAELGPIRSVLDLACGLNPLAIPWMPLEPGAAYYAYDIYADMMRFLGGYFALEAASGPARARGHSAVRDILAEPPTEAADVALLLKAIPCLEHLDASAGNRLLHAIAAKHLVISFPAHGLSGRGRGMAATYEGRFMSLIAGGSWSLKRYAFASELVFVVSKEDGS